MEKVEHKFTASGKEIKVTTGNLAHKADSAIMMQQGETVVMAFVTVDDKDTDLDYFPLGVNYMEKFYAGGVISGSRFIKRETRPSDAAVIKGRIIDRTLRPLFPADFKRGVSIVVNVLAYDKENDPAILALNAAAMAVHMSSVPFDGPVAGVRIGMSDSEDLIVNPDESILETSKLDAIVSSTRDAVTQLEVGANQVTEDKMAEAFDLAFNEAKAWLENMDLMREKAGREKIEFEIKEPAEDLLKEIKSNYGEKIEEALKDGENRSSKIDSIVEEVHEKFTQEEEEKYSISEIAEAVRKTEKAITRKLLLDGKRLSGRGMDEIREISLETSFLPRVHGSALFSRGITQVLSIATLGSTRLAQVTENFEGESEKRFMHHYSAPNYSVGEAGRFSFYPGNRELGHGALAEKALIPVIPDEDEFPYTIRVVSEVLSQNGSSSMASTCGASLSLMDAGVPIKDTVAGIALGLITEDESQKNYKLFVDAQDVEDYYGDMDFKVTGTKNGITAIQMDTKLKGVKVEILKAALPKAKEGREFILEKINQVISEPRKELSKYAPKNKTLKIRQDQIGEVIGPGGKVIKKILESVNNEADVDIKDDGTIHITAVDIERLEEVMNQLKALTEEAEIGKTYTGRVDKVMNFGIFVEVSPAIYGLAHVSELAEGFVKDANELYKVGDEVSVKLIGRNDEGKLNFSVKQAGK